MFSQTYIPANLKLFRLFGLLAALILSLSVVNSALAAPLANGDFSDSSGCTLSGWTTSGYVTTTSGGSAGIFGADSCVAQVMAFDSNFIDILNSNLSQTFTVPADLGTTPVLTFRIWAKSSNGVQPPNSSCYNMAQVVGLYYPNGQAISGNGHNYDTSAEFYFAYDVSNYAGQSLMLKIATRVDPTNACSPTSSTIYVDEVRYVTAIPRGNITFGW